MKENNLVSHEQRLELSLESAPESCDRFAYAISQLKNIDLSKIDNKDYISYIVNHENFTINYLKYLDLTIARSDNYDINLFINIILSLGKLNKIISLSCIKNSLHVLQDKDDFTRGVIELIISPNGYVRYLGRKIWDKYQLNSKSVNIETLQTIEKYFYIISMLQDLGNPEQRLPKLLPLLDSKDSNISEFLEQQLIPYTEHYLGHVTKQIDLLEIKNTEATNRIKEQIKCIASFIEKRKMCKELNSELNQLSIIEAYRKANNEHITNLSANIEKQSFLQYFSTVQILRCVCTRDSDGKEQELGNFTHSVPSSIMDSSMYEYEKTLHLKKIFFDWNTITNPEDLWKIL